jgi:hypothetical protein
MAEKPFWETKKLSEMTDEEWESLCDGCGKCCLEKLEFDTGENAFTNVACKLLDLETCRCKHYKTRQKHVPECLNLRDEDFGAFWWLPKTCAYRLLNEGKPLPAWHPLNTGDPQSAIKAGFSVKGRAVCAKPAEDLPYFVVEWDDL